MLAPKEHQQFITSSACAGGKESGAQVQSLLAAGCFINFDRIRFRLSNASPLRAGHAGGIHVGTFDPLCRRARVPLRALTGGLVFFSNEGSRPRPL